MARKKRIEHHPIVQQFAARLREVRRRRGMSQQALAHAAIVTASYVGKLERGEAAAGIDMLGRLATALGVAPETLIVQSERAVSGLPVVRAEIERHCKKLLGRKDEQGLQAVAVVLGLLDNALARRG